MAVYDAVYLWQSSPVVVRTWHVCDECNHEIPEGATALREVAVSAVDSLLGDERPGFSCIYVCDHPWCRTMRWPETFVEATRRPAGRTAREHHYHPSARQEAAREGWDRR